MGDDEILTIEEAARLLKVHPVTVKRWLAQGELPAIRIGRVVRIRKQDLLRTERREAA